MFTSRISTLGGRVAAGTLVVAGLVAVGVVPTAEATGGAPHRYYRLVIDSVGANTDGYSSVNEIRLKVGGEWLGNSNGTLGSSVHADVQFTPSVGGDYTATVDVTDECCGRDLGMLFNGADDVSWVAGYPYGAFTAGTGDSVAAGSIWVKFDFGASPVALEGMMIFGDPWDNGVAAGAEAPDRFRIQYSDNGTDYVTVSATGSDVVTYDGTGYGALFDLPAAPVTTPDDLPTTGGSTGTMALVASALIASGLVLHLLRRPKPVTTRS